MSTSVQPTTVGSRTSAANAAALDPTDFAFIQTFVKEKSAITVDSGKEYLVTARLAPVARKAGLSGISELVREIRRNPRNPLGEQVIDAMTTNETSFFRDLHPFDSLATDVLPKLIAARKTTRTLRIWCGASSSGQEIYTIAMVIRENFPEIASWNVQILGTDISPTMVEKAKSGTYSQMEVNRGLPAPLLMKYFTRRGAKWQIADEIRSMVRFETMNLVAPSPTRQAFDIVFLRNVLIYFDVPTKTQILRNVRRQLASDGYLILGGSETTVGVDNAYRRERLGRTAWYAAT